MKPNELVEKECSQRKEGVVDKPWGMQAVEERPEKHGAKKEKSGKYRTTWSGRKPVLQERKNSQLSVIPLKGQAEYGEVTTDSSNMEVTGPLKSNFREWGVEGGNQIGMGLGR